MVDRRWGIGQPPGGYPSTYIWVNKQGGPQIVIEQIDHVITLSIDEAKELVRALQSAIDDVEGRDE